MAIADLSSIASVAKTRSSRRSICHPADGGPLPTFKPGQYITVKIDSSKLQRHRATTACRTVPASATIASASSASQVRLQSAGRPGVELSSRPRNEGDVLEIGPPCGEFTLDPQTSAIDRS